MKSMVFALAAFAATITTGASAQTYDAFRDFDGTQGAGAGTGSHRFIYGTVDPNNLGAGGSFFAETGNSGCFIAMASACLQQNPNGLDVSSLPGFTKSLSQSFQYNSVDVPNNRLLAHPGDNDLLTFVAFVAPTAGIYRLFATFDTLDRTPTGVDISLLGTTNGGLPLTNTPLSFLTGVNGSYSYASGPRAFTPSEALGFGIGRAGTYNNDSTGVRFQVLEGIPEPTTWALMIMGFGLTGWAMRRKPRATATLATA